MKKFLLFVLAAMLIAGQAVAVESMLIDFTALEPDILPAGNPSRPDEPEKPMENRRTTMDYSALAGTAVTNDQKALLKTSLALRNWEVVLNASATNPNSVTNSFVKPAPVKDTVDSPYGKSAAGKNIMGVRVYFPTSKVNANARIIPPFDIPAYEPFAPRDDEGNPQRDSDEAKQAAVTYKTQFEADEPAVPSSSGYGVVKNVGAIKSINVNVFGNQYPHGLYVILKDTDEVERRYFMGNLSFDGWKYLQWNNPHYLTDVRARELRVVPVYPRGLPYVKFAGFLVTKDAASVGGDFITYFKDVSIIYDKAVLNTERDIAEEDLWGIIHTKEDAKQRNEIERFGAKQIDRFIEEQKRATEPGQYGSPANEAGFQSTWAGAEGGGAAAPAPAAQ